MAKKKYSRNNRRKKSARMSAGSLFVILIAVACASLIRAIQTESRDSESAMTSLEYGNLLEVKTSERTPEVKKSYTGMDISFNPGAHIPNWVAWELTAEETLGTEKRKSNFRPDPGVKGCPSLEDYRNSGYQRGHMAPAADMKWSPEAMSESFYLTNMCPQSGALNGGAWGKLEDKCRLLASGQGPVYIIAGPVIDGRPLEYIGAGRVYVPSRFFKVILTPYSTPAMGIGFIFPNGRVEGGMQKCAVTIDEVEALTGHDFFSSLPDELEDRLESQADFDRWSRLCTKTQ